MSPMLNSILNPLILVCLRSNMMTLSHRNTLSSKDTGKSPHFHTQMKLGKGWEWEHVSPKRMFLYILFYNFKEKKPRNNHKMVCEVNGNVCWVFWEPLQLWIVKEISAGVDNLCKHTRCKDNWPCYITISCLTCSSCAIGLTTWWKIINILQNSDIWDDKTINRCSLEVSLTSNLYFHKGKYWYQVQSHKMEINWHVGPYILQ